MSGSRISSQGKVNFTGVLSPLGTVVGGHPIRIDCFTEEDISSFVQLLIVSPSNISDKRRIKSNRSLNCNLSNTRQRRSPVSQNELFHYESYESYLLLEAMG